MVTDEEYAIALADHERFNAEPFVPSTDKSPEENLYLNTRQMTTRNRRIRTLKRYEEQKSQPTLPMEMHIIRLGNIAFATNTFELFMDYQHRMQARSPFEQTFVVQLCGQPKGCVSGSYLATERGFNNRSYSASVYCNQISVAGGAQLVEETVAELKKLAD